MGRGRSAFVLMVLTMVSATCASQEERQEVVAGSSEAESSTIPYDDPTTETSIDPGVLTDEPTVGGLEGNDDDLATTTSKSTGDAAMETATETGPDSQATSAPTPMAAVRLFLAGDSTVQTYPDSASDSDQAGWGQMLGTLLSRRVTVDNRAIGGRTARRFIDEGRLDEILGEIAAGDYLFVQFGTNDGNRTATYTIGEETIPYFLDPGTDFKTYLGLYLEGTMARGAIPVLVTPPPRNSAYCTGGNGTGAHAQAIRELGDATGVAVLDLNAHSVAYLQAICPAPSPEDFFLLRADGTVDGTHFQENGARILAGLIADSAREAGLPLFDDE